MAALQTTLQSFISQKCPIIAFHIFFLINLQRILYHLCFAGVGKSRLVIKYIKNALHRNEEPTIAVSFFTCNIILDDVKIKLQVSTTKRYEAPTFSQSYALPLPSRSPTCLYPPVILFTLSMAWASKLIWAFVATGTLARLPMLFILLFFAHFICFFIIAISASTALCVSPPSLLYLAFFFYSLLIS